MQTLLVFGLMLTSCGGLNVLLVPTQPRSHVIEMAALGDKLMERGHSVYLVVGDSFPLIPDLKKRGLQILSYTMRPSADTMRRTGNIQDAVLYTPESGDLVSEDIFVYNDKMATRAMNLTTVVVLRDCQTMLEDTGLNAAVKDANFDIAIADTFSLGTCSFLLPYIHGIPFAGAYSGGISALLYRFPALPSFTPVPFIDHGFSPKMTFWQRLVNTYLTLMVEAFPPCPALTNYTLLHRYAPEINTWPDLVRKAQIFFILKDQPLDFPEVSMPHVIRTQGVTMREGRPLPSDFQAKINRDQREIVIVSFGTVISSFPKEVITKFLTSFKQFQRYVFIFRLNKRAIEGYDQWVPDNVILCEWLPQQDLLAQRRTILLIGHGGNIGQGEAAYHAVPMICMPIFAEQFQNCMRVQIKGLAVTVDIHDFQVEELTAAITKVTGDGSYSEAARKISEIIRSSTPAGDVISYWLDHVVRFGGSHLRSAAVDMSAVEFYMLDIIGFVLVVCCTSTIVLYQLATFCVTSAKNKVYSYVKKNA